MFFFWGGSFFLLLESWKNRYNIFQINLNESARYPFERWHFVDQYDNDLEHISAEFAQRQEQYQ